MSLIGGGDMNAAMDGQRFDYVTLDHEKSDQQFKMFAEQVRGDVVSPSHVTWWDQHRKCRAILDHVIVGSQSLVRASTSVQNSCNPSHDHANVYVYARTTYLPGRPAVGGAVQSRQRIRMKAWSDNKAAWGALSKLVLESCMTQEDAHLSQQEFQERFKEILPVVIAEGVRLVGWTSPGMNRPPYRTQEVTKLMRKVRIMTAARRESYNITKESTSWTMAQKEAFAILSSPPPQLPIPEFEIERVREQFRSENSKLLKELKEITTKMEKENIQERLEEVREALGKDCFSVQKALGKISDTGSMDTLEHRVPIGLLFALSPRELESLLRHGNLEEAACWIESQDGGASSRLRAPSLEQVVPLLTLVPLYAKPVKLLWENRVAQLDSHQLWMMDHHYQQISYAKRAQCTSCSAQTPVAFPLRLNGDIDVVTYCVSCFGVHKHEAYPEGYEDLSFLGRSMDYRKVPDGEKLAGEVAFEIFMKYIGRIKERKAAGLDRFHAEFLKHADKSVQRFIHRMVNSILKQEVQIDECFLVGEIRLLFKKEPSANLPNWRPICLLQMVYKLVSLILNDCLTTLTERFHLLEDSQEGFRKVRGTGRQAQSLVWMFKRDRSCTAS
eukprot:416953-Rhodomonas_salina.2